MHVLMALIDYLIADILRNMIQWLQEINFGVRDQLHKVTREEAGHIILQHWQWVEIPWYNCTSKLWYAMAAGSSLTE